MIVHNLGVREAVSMVTIMTCAKIFLSFPHTVCGLGGTAGWLIVLISSVHGPLIWWAMAGVLRKHPDKSLVTATEAILGPFFGTIINLGYFLFFFALVFIVSREFAESSSIAFLTRTPLALMVVAFLATSVYLTALGVEAIGRTAWLGGPLMLISLVLLLIGGILTHSEPRALAPYWGTGIMPVLSYGLIEDLMGDILIFGLIAPGFRNPKDLRKAMWYSMALIAAIMTTSVVVLEYVFPYPMSSQAVMPLLQMSRVISLGAIIQRIEGIFFLIWVVGGCLKISLGLFGSAASLAQILHVPNYRPLLVPLTLLVFAVALIPTGIESVIRWDEAFRLLTGVVTILFPAFTALVGLVRHKGGANHAQQ